MEHGQHPNLKMDIDVPNNYNKTWQSKKTCSADCCVVTEFVPMMYH